MSDITINNSPIHSDSIITNPYGVQNSGYSCGWHTGVDFAPYGTTEANPMLYSVKNGTVVYVNNDTSQALGVQAQIEDDEGNFWRYCHMVARKFAGSSWRYSNIKHTNRKNGKYWKFNWSAFTFRIFINNDMAMCNFFKSMYKTYYSK